MDRVKVGVASSRTWQRQRWCTREVVQIRSGSSKLPRVPCLQPCHLLPELESYSSSCVLRRNPGVPAATAHGAHAGIPGGSNSICKTYLIIEHIHSLRRGLRLDLDGSLTNRCLTLWSTAECFISQGSPKGSETTAVLARGRNGSS